jgi:hypothetical protein
MFCGKVNDKYFILLNISNGFMQCNLYRYINPRC